MSIKKVEDIYVETLLKKVVVLESWQINSALNENILTDLRKIYGDKCIQEGYVKEESIKVLKRSVGRVVAGHFTGRVNYDVIFSAEICNPVAGNVVPCKIMGLNKLGILADSDTMPFLKIIIPRELHEDKSIFRNLKVGDKIKMKVVGRKYKLHDREIRIVGHLISDKDIQNLEKEVKNETIVPVKAKDKQPTPKRRRFLKKLNESLGKARGTVETSEEIADNMAEQDTLEEEMDVLTGEKNSLKDNNTDLDINTN